jgi:very-short-patch-repair endonuclease
METNRALSGLAAEQHSLFTRRQALDLGLTARQLGSRLADGVVRRVHRGVYAFASSAATFEQSVMAACLAVGGVASHRCAAALWELRGMEPSIVEVTVLSRRTPQLDGVVVHRTIDLAPADIRRRQAIPVVSPARTLLDLGGVAPRQLEAALDDALIRGLLSLPFLERFLQRSGRRGRPGTGALRSLVMERLDGKGSTESPLEDELASLLRRHGLPEPLRGYRLVIQGRTVRLDLAYPVVKLSLEADGRRWHSSRADFQRDRTRANLLAAEGWTVLRFTADDIRKRGAEVAAEVAGVLQMLERRAG